MRIRQQRQGGTNLSGNKKHKCLSKYNVSPLRECRQTRFRPAFGAVSGSLTAEAALALTLFIFTVILLAAPVEMLDTHRRVQMVLEAAAREMAADAVLLQGGTDEAREDAEGEAERSGRMRVRCQRATWSKRRLPPPARPRPSQPSAGRS